MFAGADLRRAAVFHAVAQAGGISAAARAIGKSAPTVHSDLRRFERDVGTTLMERSGRSLRLTAQGRTLFETISRALDDLARARDQIVRSELAPIRVGAVTGFGRYQLAQSLFQLLPAARPVTLVTGAHDDLLDQLLRGRIDFAVTYRAVTAVPITSIPNAEETLVLVGAEGAADSFEEVSALRFVTYDEYDYVFGRWFAGVYDRQPQAIRRHDHCTELEEALASVRAGRGATVAPADACSAFGLRPVGGSCTNSLYLCGVGNLLASPEAETIRRCISAPDQMRP